MKNILVILILFVFCSGCIGVNTALYPGKNYPPTNSKNVQLLHSFPPDKNTYEIIGEMSLGGMLGTYEDYPSLKWRLRTEAAAKGADAVVLWNNQGNARNFPQSDTVYSSAQTSKGSYSGFLLKYK